MDDRISDAELDLIDERVARASRAPWQSFIEGRDQMSGSDFIMVGPSDDREPDMYVSREAVPAASADLDFIANSRQDVPRLVAEIRRLRANASGNPD